MAGNHLGIKLRSDLFEFLPAVTALFICLLLPVAPAQAVQRQVGDHEIEMDEVDAAYAGREEEILDAVAAALSQSAELLPLTALTIEVHFSSRKSIPGWGTGGYAGSAELVQLYIDPEYADHPDLVTERIPRIVAHELHHAARWHMVGYGNTLFTAMISEGLADQFALQVYGGTAPPWTSALDSEEGTKMWSLARKKLDKSGYDHSDWFYGTDDAIPAWTGYTLGFRVVETHMEIHPGATPADLVGVPASDFKPAWKRLKAELAGTDR